MNNYSLAKERRRRDLSETARYKRSAQKIAQNLAREAKQKTQEIQKSEKVRVEALKACERHIRLVKRSEVSSTM